jgi:hypothetical protein
MLDLELVVAPLGSLSVLAKSSNDMTRALRINDDPSCHRCGAFGV